MSPLKRAASRATIALLAALLVTADARADEAVPPDVASRIMRWDASLRAGWGSVFTDGLSYLGTGIGAGIGLRPQPRLRLELSGLVAFGERVEAANESLMYRSSSSSAQATLGVGYEIVHAGALFLRPAIRGGARLVTNRVVVGSAEELDRHLLPLVGPAVAVGLRRGRFEIALDGEAFFIPTWPAAPSAGLYGAVAIVF